MFVEKLSNLIILLYLIYTYNILNQKCVYCDIKILRVNDLNCIKRAKVLCKIKVWLVVMINAVLESLHCVLVYGLCENRHK